MFDIPLLVFFSLIGICIGSFLNVLIDRLSNEQSIDGRSHCDYCKKTLQVSDLIPVFSYIFLRGRCRYCKKRLSPQYPLVEIATSVIFFLIAQNGLGSNYFVLLLHLILASSFIVIFVADLKYQIIPDEMQIVFFVTSVVLFLTTHSVQSLPMRLGEGLLVMAPILLIFVLTRQKGMGFADVKLAVSIGVFLGLRLGLYALYFAFVIGGVVGIIMLLSRQKKLKSQIAFGPFMIMGTVLVYCFYDKIWQFLPY